MSAKRTGNTQTEKTKTGVITTAEERVQPKKGKPYTRWVQIGYTSVQLNESSGKKYIDGPYGQALLGEAA